MGYFINRLKNGVGSEKDFYVPRGCRVLSCTDSFAISDDEVPQPLKDYGVKLMFHPNVYTLKRDRTGKLALTDISEQTVNKPTTLAYLRPDKAVPEVIINGAMLCVDCAAEKNFTAEEQAETTRMIKHFEKIKSRDPGESVRHELKHLENQLAFAALQRHGGALSEELFVRSCYLDEISATVAETIGRQNRSRTENEALVRRTFTQWMNNPGNREVYTAKNGDFQRRWDAYEPTTRGRDSSQAADIYQKLTKAYFTFEINGQKEDFSNAVKADFALQHKQPQVSRRAMLCR